jgi:hypothetical protein
MKVVFLDIDGVLQPGGRQTRFEHKDEYPELAKQLNKDIPGDFDYFAYINGNYSNTCDLGAVYYDWDKPAVERLRNILDTTDAKIVLSSSWRDMGMRVMRALMAIHGLDKYLVDSTFYIALKEMREEGYDEKRKATGDIFNKIEEALQRIVPDNPHPWYKRHVCGRTAEIREYLDRHPEIVAYAAIDDMYLENGLNGHYVGTDHWIEEEHVQKCIDILNNEDGPYPLNKETYTDELEAWREKYVYQ